MEINSDNQKKYQHHHSIYKDQEPISPQNNQNKYETLSASVFQINKQFELQSPPKREEQIFLKLLSEDRNYQHSQNIEDKPQNKQIRLSQQQSSKYMIKSIAAATNKKKHRELQLNVQNEIINDFKGIILTIGCKCRRTNCLKNYCECYKAKKICQRSCVCLNCHNNDEILHNERKKQKKIGNDIFCNCKKSECDKKYCQCYSNGQKCSQKCNCSECKNMICLKDVRKWDKFKIYEGMNNTIKKKRVMIDEQ